MWNRARDRRFITTKVLAAATLALGMSTACAGARPVRTFPDCAIAWEEHDSEDVPRAPRPTDLGDMDSTLIARDDFAGQVDRALALEGARPARDVNAVDEVPCSTWFCPRNHLQPMTLAAIAAGPSGTPPRLPLRIVKGKDRGAALGFQVVDADGRKYLLKLDPKGHLGMSTAAEIVGTRLYHAAGYNVPSNFLLDLAPGDLIVDPKATFKLYDVQRRPLTPALVRERLEGAARTADGRLRAVAVSWLGGKVLGAYDMQGRRPDDPNDRIGHEDRRSLRAGWMLAAWLAVFDASALNTLDTYAEENGRHFVRHYVIDFGAGLGSATSDVKGPDNGGQHLVEIGRTLAEAFSLGLYQRSYQRQREAWRASVAEHAAVGWYPADDFDVESFRTNRSIPAHQRMTDRDAYWAAKLVTSFTDEQLAAVVAATRLDEREAAFLRRALGARRDAIGRRYLTAVSAVEAPATVVDAGGARLCFDDLAIERAFVDAQRVRYRVGIGDERGRSFGESLVPAQGPRTCVALPRIPGSYRVMTIGAELPGADGGWRRAKPTRVHLRADQVVGLERDE
jgi:hypothetical protein